MSDSGRAWPFSCFPADAESGPHAGGNDSRRKSETETHHLSNKANKRSPSARETPSLESVLSSRPVTARSYRRSRPDGPQPIIRVDQGDLHGLAFPVIHEDAIAVGLGGPRVLRGFLFTAPASHRPGATAAGSRFFSGRARGRQRPSRRTRKERERESLGPGRSARLKGDQASDKQFFVQL